MPHPIAQVACPLTISCPRAQVKRLLEALKTTTQEMDTRFQSSIDQDLSSLKELETAVRAAVDGLSERVTGLETGGGKQDNRLASCVRSHPFPHKTVLHELARGTLFEVSEQHLGSDTSLGVWQGGASHRERLEGAVRPDTDLEEPGTHAIPRI